MTTSDRLLAVLDLFSGDESEWTVDAAAAKVGLSVSTTYRYFHSLASAGLIVASLTGRYVLGPAILKFDRRMRLSDPLITAAQPVMKAVSRRLPDNAVVLLCRLFRNEVMCVHQEAVDRPEFAVSYERGRPMPLHRGASSKIIFAFMPARTVRAYYAKHVEEIAAAGLGDSLQALQQSLRELRAARYAITHGELDQGMVGIAVPLINPDGAVIGSISVVMRQAQARGENRDRALDLLMQGSAEIGERLSERADDGERSTGAPDLPAKTKTRSKA